MKIAINTLHIHGYRGQNLDVTFGEKDTIISGENGAGKSTTYNALLWLLLGVDADDNTNKNIFTDPRIAPDDPDNPKTAKVEAKLIIDGSETTLTKLALQTWKYDKSAEELVRVADAYHYYINGFEVTATEYKQFVADNFGRADGYLKLMLNPRFWEMLDTRSLRKYFAEIVGRFSEADFKGDYSDVASDIKKDGAEKVLKRYRDERKKYDTLADATKEKLAETKVPSLAEIETAEAKAESLEKEKQYLETRRAALAGQNDEIVAKRKAEEDAIYAKNKELLLAKIRYENELSETERMLVAKLDALRENNATENRRREQAERDIEDLKLRLSTAKMRLEEMRNELKMIKIRTFDGTCSVCGNSFIGAKRAERLEAFRAKKEYDLKKNIEDGLAMKAKEESLSADLAEAEARLNGIERVDTRAAEDALIDFRKNRKAWEVTDEYKRLTAELAELEQGRTEIPTNDELTQLQVRMGEIDAELKALYMEIGNKRGDYNKGNAEVDRLKALIAEYRQQSATARKHEAQVLEWQREYAELVSKRVNENFKNVQVEMTAMNKSGGLEDVCKLRLEGVADTCNYANRIKIGIEVAQVFQKHFGVVLPLFVDNAESITEIPEHDGQRVMLRVVEGSPLTVTTKE